MDPAARRMTLNSKAASDVRRFFRPNEPLHHPLLH
jgi:hypothetical protein